MTRDADVARELAEHFDEVCAEHGSIATDYVARKIAAALDQARAEGDVRAVLVQLRERRDGQRAWLAEHAPRINEEQRHTVEGTAERAYWHYGYMVALHDVLARLDGA